MFFSPSSSSSTLCGISWIVFTERQEAGFYLMQPCSSMTLNPIYQFKHWEEWLLRKINLPFFFPMKMHVLWDDEVVGSHQCPHKGLLWVKWGMICSMLFGWAKVLMCAHGRVGGLVTQTPSVWGSTEGWPCAYAEPSFQGEFCSWFSSCFGKRPVGSVFGRLGLLEGYMWLVGPCNWWHKSYFLSWILSLKFF